MADILISTGLDTKQAEKDIQHLGEQIDGAFQEGRAVSIDTTDAAKQLDALTTPEIAPELDAGPLKKALKDVGETPIEPHVDTKGAEKELHGISNLLHFEALGEAAEKMQAFAEKGHEAHEAFRILQAQTGATAEQMHELESSASSLFTKGLGENVGEAAKALANTKAQLGGVFDTQEIEAFTLQAAAIGKVFEKDVNEVVAKSKTLITQFGLSGDEASRLISFGMQQAKTGADDFLDTIDEFAPLMKQAGYNANELAGLFENASKAGARNLTLVGDAVKETQIRLRAGDIDSALSGVGGPIADTIQGIVNAGKAGTISVKEVLSQSSLAIDKAFNAGEIGEQIKVQLQSAIAGSKAEDLGASLYSKIFSAPIDAESVKARSFAAANTIKTALGPVTFFEKAEKQVNAIATKFSGLAAPLIAGVDSAVESFSAFAPAANFVSQNLDNIKNVGTKTFSFIAENGPKAFDALGGIGGKAFGAIGDFASNGLTTLTKGFGSATLSATTFWGAALIGIPLIIGGLVLLYEKSEPFKKFVDDLGASIGAFFSNLWDGIRELAGGISAAWDALTSGNFTGIGEAFSKGMDTAAKEIKKDKLKNAFNDALGQIGDLSVKVKANADTSKLVDEFGKAKNEVASLQDKLSAAKSSGDQTAIGQLEKQLGTAQQKVANLGSEIGEKLPGSVSKIDYVTDAHGKLVKQVDVNIDKARELTDAQKKIYSKETLDAQAKFNGGLTAQADDVVQAQKALKEAADKAAKDPSDANQKNLEELQKKASDVGSTLVKSLKAGKDAGILTAESYQTVGKALGKSADEVKRMVEYEEKASRTAATLKQQMQDAAKSFGDALTQAQGAAQTGVGSIAQRTKQIQDSVKKEAELRKAGDKEGADAERENRAKLQEDLKVFQAESLKGAADARKLNKIQDDAAFKSDVNRQNDLRATKKTAAEQTRKDLADVDSARIADVRARERQQLKDQQEFERASLDIQIKQLQNKAGKTTEELAQLAKLNSDRTVLVAKQGLAEQQLRAKYEKEDYDTLVDTESKKNEALTAAIQNRIDILTKQGEIKGVLGLPDVEELATRRVELVRAQAKTELRAFVEATNEFTKGKALIDARVEVGELNKEQAIAEVEKLRQAIAAKLANGNDAFAKQYQQLVEKQGQTETQQAAQNQLDINAARIHGIEDRHEREQALAVEAARVQLLADLKAAGDNNEMKLDAYAKFLDAKHAADDAYNRTFADSQKALNAYSQEFARGVFDAYKNDLDVFLTANQKSLEDALSKTADDFAKEVEAEKKALEDAYKSQSDELEQQLRSGFITHEEYNAALVKMREERAEKEKAIDDKTFDAGEKQLLRFRKAVADSFAGVRKSISEQLTKTIAESKGGFTDLGAVAAETAGILLVSFGQMAASGKATLGDFAGAALDTLNQVYAELAAKNIVAIFETAIGLLGPIAGPIAAAAALVAIPALISAASAGLHSKTGYHGGGYTGDGNEYDVAGPVHAEEVVFERKIVKGQKDDVLEIRKALQSGISAGELLDAYSAFSELDALLSSNGITTARPLATSSGTFEAIQGSPYDFSRVHGAVNAQLVAARTAREDRFLRVAEQRAEIIEEQSRTIAELSSNVRALTERVQQLAEQLGDGVPVAVRGRVEHQYTDKASTLRKQLEIIQEKNLCR